jgi:HK97 family phage major capsid protein
VKAIQWTKSLLNFFYPNRCPACEALIGAHELLCNACGDALLLEQDGYCHYCGKTICRCSKFPHAYDRAVVCSAYEGGAVPAVIALKRSSNTNFAVYAAQILARRLEQGALYYHKIDCVMPVPMHRSKQRQRGYNQAALIGKEIARLMDVPYREDVLCKGRSKVEQHQLSAEERAQNTEPAPDAPAPEIHAQEVRTAMRKNIIFDRMAAQERTALIQREDVKAWLTEVRACMTEKRAITNVGLTIPEVMLGLLRENVIVYSKLYKHVTVRPVGGTARQLIMGTVPEAIWTDCCANLNELTLGFNDLEMDCFKVGGFFAICNANLEDSDIDLAAELLSALGQAIGLALDKAILYGRNASGTQKMPMGIVSRLVQTEVPTGYPATARTWADLHTSNVISITAANSTGIKLFQSLVSASGAIKGKYSRGEKTWVMNEATYTALTAEAMAVNAAGAIVSGMGATMPVIGGAVEVLSFIPDNVIIGGYFDLYILAERAGQKFAQSEHVRFLQDQTVFKGTARYDGAPAIAEGFAAIGIKGTTPNAAMTFPTDTANA